MARPARGQEVLHKAQELLAKTKNMALVALSIDLLFHNSPEPVLRRV